jgi:fatty-acyl-CoA synthase
LSLHPIHHAQTRPDHPAVIMAGSGANMTFGQMDERSNRFAHLLRAHGLGPDHGFAVLLENRIEFFTLIWGSQRAGTMLVPISTRLTAPEIAYILRDSGAKLLITSTAFAHVLGQLRGEFPDLPMLVILLAHSPRSPPSPLPILARAWSCFTARALPAARRVSGPRLPPIPIRRRAFR